MINTMTPEVHYIISFLFLMITITLNYVDLTTSMGIHGRQKPSKKGSDLNREVSHIKYQCYKNVRAEGANLF